MSETTANDYIFADSKYLEIEVIHRGSIIDHR